MRHFFISRFWPACVLAIAGGQSQAQALDVGFSTYCPPNSQAACFASSIVDGLDPNGDGFLAVRTGPGTDYPMIDMLYNGDVVIVHTGSGPWVGVSYGDGQRLGWVHRNWLIDGAG